VQRQIDRGKKQEPKVMTINNNLYFFVRAQKHEMIYVYKAAPIRRRRRRKRKIYYYSIALLNVAVEGWVAAASCTKALFIAYLYKNLIFPSLLRSATGVDMLVMEAPAI